VTQKEKQKTIKIIQAKYGLVNSYLNERSRRIWAATEAKMVGKGGKSIVHKATNLDFKTIQQGLLELEKKEAERVDINRIRKEGGGRQRNADKDSSFRSELEKIVEPATVGDPERPFLTGFMKLTEIRAG